MSIAEIIRSYRNVAVVGLSPDPSRPSHRVAAYLAANGYNIIPVNPRCRRLMDRPCYPSLAAVPEKVEIVDIFRRSGEVMPVVEEAVGIGARVIWMQEGIINEEAAARAEEAGLQVVMDRCMLKEHMRLGQVKERDD